MKCLESYKWTTPEPCPECGESGYYTYFFRREDGFHIGVDLCDRCAQLLDTMLSLAE